MKRLWVAAALAPLSFAATAQAQVTISNSTSTPIQTLTVNNGQPADIIIGSGGSVNPTMAGTTAAQTTAVTLNSYNSVTNNGSITTSNLNYVTGILGIGGNVGTAGISINNAGAISLSETATQHTNGTNGIADGIYVNGTFVSNFAQGTDRFGILVTGTSPLVGNLINSGSITIVGENSAAIQIGAGGLTGAPVTGTFVGTGVVSGLTSSGAISITGDNVAGIHSLGLITGSAEISGAITATGTGAVGLALDQGATGNVDLANAITVTGFHSLTPPVNTTTLNNSLESVQLQASGPAVSIGGSVGGGITIDAPAAAIAAVGTTPAVAAVVGGTITADGSTAIVIGNATGTPITIGPSSLPGGPSLFIAGTVTSNGVYQNFNAEGIQIGSVGSTVSLPGGIDIPGSISASSVATSIPNVAGSGQGNGNVIGLELMSGVSTSNITVGAINSIAGAISASSTSTVNNSVTAIQIDAGATRLGGVGAVLNNYGTIDASITGIAAVIGGQAAAGGTGGTAIAISDQAGVLGQINNSGVISATIVPIVTGQTETGTTTALDLRGNTLGVTVTQTQAPVIPAVAATATTAATSATTPAAPSITGDVLFGSGNANLNLLAGTLVGAVSFGTGTNSLDLENGATMTGALQENGGSIALSVGANGNNVATSTLTMIESPTIGASRINLSSLNIGASGQVIFTLDPANGVGYQFAVAGNANLAAGAKIGLNIISATPNETTFTLIGAGTLTSATTAQALLGASTYLFNETLTQTTGANGSITVDVSPRTAAQLGLNPSEAAAYPAILDVLQASNQDAQAAAITADVLSKTNKSDFVHLYDQFLPDFEGGPFDTLAVAQGQMAAAEADTPIKLQTDEVRGWVQEIGYLDYRQDNATTNGYRAGGFGVIGGLEQARGDGAVGVSASFVTDGVVDDRQGPGANVSSTALEAGVYWRDQWGGLSMHASINGGYVYLSSDRLLFDQDSSGNVNLFDEAKSQWNGATASAEFGASYQIPIGKFYVRPEVIADYVYLYESAYTEHGGGAEMDLAVASRNSEEATAQGDLVFGADLGGVYHWRPELTVGWREVLSGGPGNTTAHFVSGGPSFTLSPQFEEKGSLIARIGLRAGGNFADFSADAGGEFNNTYQVYNARAVARFLF